MLAKTLNILLEVELPRPPGLKLLRVSFVGVHLDTMCAGCTGIKQFLTLNLFQARS
jgi:hypothetical protein